jgi:hypothetical protein
LHSRQACAFFSLSQFFFIVDFSHRGTITQKRRSQLPAHLDLRNNLAEQRKVHHHRHGYHLKLLLPRHPPLSLALLGQQEQFRPLISPVLDGALLS